MVDLNKIKIIIERAKCPVHGEHPSAQIKGDNISVQACCEKFRDEMLKLLDKLIDQSIGGGSSEIA